MAFIIKFTYTQIDHSLFIVGIVLICGFWISDATAYFYQKRLRVRITECFRMIASRNQTEQVPQEGDATVADALFNASMSLYYVLGVLFVCSWIAFAMRWIG